MRPRGGGIGHNRHSREQRLAARPVYEDFRPVSERHQEEEAEKLLIFLPGFIKENMRVSTEGKNTVRVRGERFIGGNKWHRFQEDFQAPDDCNMRGIHAKFENGILIITMPWKIPKQSFDEHTKQTPDKDENVPPKTTHPTVETPRNPTPLKPTAQLPKPQNAHKDQDSTVKDKKQRDEALGSAESSQTQKDGNVPPKTTHPTVEIPRKPTPLKPSSQLSKPEHVDKAQDFRVKDKQRDGTPGSVESATTQKGDNVPPKTTYPTIEATPRKPTPSKSTAQLPKPQNAYKDDQDSRVKEKLRDENKFFDEKGAESSKTQKGDEDIDFPARSATLFGKTSGERGKPKDETKTLEGLVGSIEPTIQKGREENLDQNKTQMVKSGKEVEKESHDAEGKKIAEKIQEKVGQKGSKEKENTSSVAARTSSYHDSITNLKKSFVDLNEERQLLVNAGAAMLVIMALGTYIYHSIRSGRAE